MLYLASQDVENIVCGPESKHFISSQTSNGLFIRHGEENRCHLGVIKSQYIVVDVIYVVSSCCVSVVSASVLSFQRPLRVLVHQ